MSEVNGKKGVGKALDVETWDAMKAAGYTEKELQADQPFGPVIFSYSRAQAIEDGVLVDVTEVAKKEGFCIHTVMTATLFGEAIRSPAGTTPPEGVKVEDETCIRWLLKRLRLVIAGKDPQGNRLLGKDEVHFKLGSIAAWALIGSGDAGEAVLTIMLEGED